MNLETVNLDDFLVGNGLDRFITDLEKAYSENVKNDEKKQEADDDASTRLSLRTQDL